MEIKILPPRWPNFVGADAGPALNNPSEKMIPIGELDDEAIEELCESFRDHCRKKRAAREASCPS